MIAKNEHFVILATPIRSGASGIGKRMLDKTSMTFSYSFLKKLLFKPFYQPLFRKNGVIVILRAPRKDSV